ncbi:hypothetical protein HRbin17_00040 [bacterium HR17]|uniref:YfhO family protein n=1 Tax=Candidatus Fervidibacter japonicus TaxID=2035412 RepID=A0A2H5X8N2_9BACT|nr:hypothetical protein HRbin17_00040 [bacterium HR17]
MALHRRHDGAWVVVLVALPTLLLWSVTFGGKTLAPVDLLLVMSPWRHFAAERFAAFHAVKAPLLDVVQQYFPWRRFYAEQVRQGELPLWNPFMFCGTSFVGNGMSAIFYPLNVLFVTLPVEVAFGWVAWLHLILTGIFMFGFLRRCVSPLAALTGAVAFQLCGFFVAWLAYLPLLCTAVWLPAALWAFETGRGTPDVRRTTTTLFALLAGGALGMALLAGHPQIGFYVLWAFAVYAVVRIVGDWWLSRDWQRPLLLSGLAMAGGVAVGAPQLLPLLEMAQISFRSGADAAVAAASNRLPVDQFVRLFIPSFFGDWRSGTHFVWDFARFNFVERTGYPGVITFLLATVALLPCWATRQAPHPSAEPVRRLFSRAPFLAGVVLAVVGLLAASVPWVHRLMGLGLPGTQAFVGISRALFLFDFGIAVLAAHGVDALAPKPVPSSVPRPSSPALFPFGLVIALLLMAVCVSYGVTAHADMAFHPLLRDFTLAQIYRWLLLTALGTLVIFCAVRFTASAPAYLSTATLTRLHTCALYALPFLVAADLLVFAWGQHPEADRAMAFFETPSIRWLKRHLGTQRFIAVGTDAIKHWTPSNTLMVYGLRDAQGSDSLMTARIFRFLQTWDKHAPLHQAFAVRNFRSPLLDLMAVRYIVAAVPLSATERTHLRLVHAGDLWVYENPDALPRAFVVSRWRWVDAPQDALRCITASGFDPRAVAVMEGARDMGRGTRNNKPSSINPRPSSPAHFSDRVNTLRIEVRMSQPAALVVADGAYPGWQVFGKSVRHGAGDKGWKQLPWFVADYAFRAVVLPAGEWQIVWVYFPSSVIVGVFLSLAAVSVTVATFTAYLCYKSGKGMFTTEAQSKR